MFVPEYDWIAREPIGFQWPLEALAEQVTVAAAGF